MSEKKYVIRGYEFGYNDECSYVEGNRVKCSFIDKELAESVYESLEIKAARRFDLSEVENLFDGNDHLLKKCDQFMFVTCGVRLLNNEGYIERGLYLPKNMRDDDVLKFVEIAQMHSYQLLAFNNSPSFYVLWIPKENTYASYQTEGMKYLHYANSKLELQSGMDDMIEDNGLNPLVIKGKLNEISDTPVLLERLVDQNKKISYSEKNETLKVVGYEPAPYFSVNPLLKKPLFEMHKISLEELMALEKKLAESAWEEYA